MHLHLRTPSRRALAALAGSGVLAALLAALPIGAQPAPGQPASNVKVVNGPAEPVPVAVQGSAAVAATQQGDWSVGTRALDAPALQPVQRSGAAVIPSGQRHATFVAYSVPAGKRLVIEYVSSEGRLGQGTDAGRVAVLTRTGNHVVGHTFGLTGLGWFDGVGELLTASELVRLYADPGTDVIVSVELNEPAGGGRVEVDFTGHLVDLP